MQLVNPMERVFTLGTMERSMKASGTQVGRKAMESGRASRETTTLVLGRIIKPMDMESTLG